MLIAMFIRSPLILFWLFLIYIKFSDESGQNCPANITKQGEYCLIEKSREEGVVQSITWCLNQDEKCFTQTGAEGVGRLLTDCEMPCSNERNPRHKTCGKSPEGIPIVCCPVELNQRISAQKCKEYMEFACDKSYVADVQNRNLMESKTPNCVFNAQPLRRRREFPHTVPGEREARRREFPHMALVGYNHSNTIVWLCGGSLISDQFVLTAAHCLMDDKFGPAIIIRLGEHDTNRTDEAATIDVRIIQYFPHREYVRGQLYNDIALLKLRRKVELDGAIRPACLPDEIDTSKKFIATGWGEYAYQEVGTVLMKVTVELFNETDCKSNFQTSTTLPSGILNATQLCAGSQNFINNTCKGDSGGPLQIYHKTNFCSYTILGVTSFGKPCHIKDIPGVYTRVHPYLDWIEGIVWLNKTN